MPNPKQIPVAIDDFQSAKHLIDYVGELAGGHDDFKIHLFHAAGPLPPQLLESPGAEGSAAEQHIEQKQVRQQESCGLRSSFTRTSANNWSPNRRIWPSAW
jgi:hypothetical protein